MQIICKEQSVQKVKGLNIFWIHNPNSSDLEFSAFYSIILNNGKYIAVHTVKNAVNTY